MRSVSWAGLFVGFALAAPAAAQTVTFGTTSGQVNNVPVNTNAANNALTQATQSSFSLRSMFPNFALPGADPVSGASIIPSPASMGQEAYLKTYFNFQFPTQTNPNPNKPHHRFWFF